MGYGCPVCGDPQADGVHLANHLALTAMIRGGDHETYLDEHVPGWEKLDEEDLATELAEVAEDVEYPQVFEDTSDNASAHEHGATQNDAGTHQHGSPHEHGIADRPRTGDGVPDGPSDAETERILEKAQELTRKRREDDVESGEGEDGSREENDTGDEHDDRE